MFRCVNVTRKALPAAFKRRQKTVEDLPYCLMLLKTLREEVLEANLELVRRGLVLYTFGNVSGIDRKRDWLPSSPAAFPTKSSSRSTCDL